MTAPATPSFLVDTNVWLSHYLGQRTNHHEASSFIVAAGKRDAALFCPVHCVKDAYYLIGADLKRQARELGDCGDAMAAAANEASWACIRNLTEIATVVGADLADVVEARALRPVHPDFEDDLLVSAARRCNADYLVTFDKLLRSHCPMAALTPAEAEALLIG